MHGGEAEMLCIRRHEVWDALLKRLNPMCAASLVVFRFWLKRMQCCERDGRMISTDSLRTEHGMAINGNIAPIFHKRPSEVPGRCDCVNLRKKCSPTNWTSAPVTCKSLEAGKYLPSIPTLIALRKVLRASWEAVFKDCR